MSGSNRGIVAALGGIIAAVFLWFLISDLNSVTRSIEHRAADAARHYARDADEQIRERCASLAAPDRPNCIREADQAARENQRVELDLAAQQVTAWWTKTMGVAALIGMALSAIGVALVWTTFAETRVANEISRQALVAQNRAWLVVEKLDVSDLSYKFEEGQIVVSGTVIFTLKNTGGSAASHIWTRQIVGEAPNIWGKLSLEKSMPMGLENLPPEGRGKVSADVQIATPLKPKGNYLAPMRACISLTYNGGGAKDFVTECSWAVSSWRDDPDLGWGDGTFQAYGGGGINLDASAIFGYFREVT